MGFKRNGEIDVLRFFFAVIILIHHFNAVFPVNLLGNGYIGVEFFFLVAGFLMAQQVKRMQPGPGSSGEIANATWGFIFKKVCSFYPYYFAALILRLVVFHIVLDYKGVREILSLLLQSIPSFTLTFFGLNFSCPFLYESTSWYLSVMLISMFILYPVLVKDREMAVKIIFPVVSLFLLGYLYQVYGFISPYSDWAGICYVGIFRGISQIALGASLSALSDWLAETQPRWLYPSKGWVKFCLTGVKLGCYGIVLLFAQGLPMESIHVFLFLAIGVLMSFSHVGHTIPDNPVPRYLGRISLPIYIFHGILRELAGDLMPDGTGTVQVLVMSAGSILICIALMYATEFVWKRTAAFLKQV